MCISGFLRKMLRQYRRCRICGKFQDALKATAGPPKTRIRKAEFRMLSLDKVFNAQTVLKSIIRETNVVRAFGIAPECELYLKPENLQITGSFKVRGSAYKIAMLSDEEKKKGVIACSAGNHAQGVALAATKNGIKSLICLPDSAPISKVVS